MRRSILFVLLAAALPAAAQADVRITEFMYQGANSGNREFLELTNIGNAAVDIANWTYNDDNPNNPVAFGAGFGSLAANESIILTELSAADFRTYWGLSSSVRVFSIGGNSNLGNGDTINIYNSATQSAATLVDTLTYASGSNTPGISRNRPVGGAGATLNTAWINSVAGDVYGSALAPAAGDKDLANPGRYPLAAAGVPEPATWAMLIGGFGLAGGALRRRARATVTA